MTFIRSVPDMVSTARVSGGLVTTASPTTIDVSAGVAQFLDPTDPLAPVHDTISFGPLLGVTPANLLTSTVTFYSIDINGQLVESIIAPSTLERRTEAFIGFSQHPAGTLTNVGSATSTPYIDIPANLADLALSVGDVNLSGNIIEANGTNLNFNKTAGTTFALQRALFTQPLDPNVFSSPAAVPAGFLSTYRNGVGGFTTVFPTITLDVGLTDDGSGTLAALGANVWQNWRVVYSPGPEVFIVLYGQNTYGTAASAQAAIFTEPHDRDPIAGGTLDTIGTITARGGGIDLSNTGDAVFTATHRFKKV